MSDQPWNRGMGKFLRFLSTIYSTSSRLNINSPKLKGQFGKTRGMCFGGEATGICGLEIEKLGCEFGYTESLEISAITRMQCWQWGDTAQGAGVTKKSVATCEAACRERPEEDVQRGRGEAHHSAKLAFGLQLGSLP